MPGDPPSAPGRWEWDPATGAVDGSATAGVLFGLPEGRTHTDLDEVLAGIRPAHRRRVAATLRAAVDADAPFRSRFSTVAVPSRTLLVVGRPVVVGGDRRLAGSVEDVTESSRREQTDQRSRRLAGLGQFASGMAHDVNNLLTVVSMRADMIRTDALEGVAGDAAGDAAAILDAADRTAALTRKLMAFAGRQEGEVAPVDLAELADGLRPLVSSLRGPGGVVHFDLHPVPSVLADRVQLEQVVVDLARNARDALTDSPPGDDAVPCTTIRVRTETAGDRPLVVLEVVDNGPGMDEETLARSCDPFFTTRPTGVGAGLGLSVVFGIAERLGGRLELVSEPGAGTTARVLLPAIGTADRSAGRDGVDATAARVVVVGDEPGRLAARARVLERAGHDVVPVPDGRSALAALAADPRVVAVVSDAPEPGRVPAMGGTELAGLVLRDHPTVRVLLVTGTAAPTDVLVHPRVAGVDGPVTGSQLVVHLHDLLATGTD